MILCPFHEDTNPSLSISLGGSKHPGVFHCFGCGASGNYNTLALKIGLRTINGDDFTDSYYYVNKQKIELFSPIDEDTLEISPLGQGFKWKRYKTSFLKRFGTKKLWHDKFSDYYLYFPLTYLYDRYGFVRARIFPQSYGPKYWFGLKKKILYPFDYLLDYRVSVIVLVEGLADAFRLIRCRIPSLSILGSSLTSLEYEMLETVGIEGVILCFDGDDPGRLAVTGSRYRKGVAQSLSGKGYEVRVLFPPKKHDPDSMPFRYVQVLQHLVLKMGGELLPEKK